MYLLRLLKFLSLSLDFRVMELSSMFALRMTWYDSSIILGMIMLQITFTWKF